MAFQSRAATNAPRPLLYSPPCSAATLLACLAAHTHTTTDELVAVCGACGRSVCVCVVARVLVAGC